MALGATTWALLALMCALAQVSGRRDAGPPKLQPPSVAEHVQWLKPRRDKRVDRRSDEQTLVVTYGSYGQPFVRIDSDGSVKPLQHSAVYKRKAPRARGGSEQWNYRTVIPTWRGIAWYAWKTGLIEVHPTVNAKGERDLLAVPAGFYEKPLFGKRTREELREEQLRKAERRVAAELVSVAENVDKAELVKGKFDAEMRRREGERAARLKREEIDADEAFKESQKDYRIAFAFERRTELSRERLARAQLAAKTIEAQLGTMESQGPRAAQKAEEARGAERVLAETEPEVEEEAVDEYARAIEKRVSRVARGRKAPLPMNEVEERLQRLGRGRK